ncbi:BatA domain-containing protein [Adhaeribacter sp. BT258]|uniref:BatA domain-containing protein n=1 Tax=Adhaeribacter terrigena TaxID=2793070 RepID=A0ABS1C5Y4_9BACT|nr:BatA domain-containing protein [Adhaeribacter terrigena]MBK0404631.1 BatA domain-containing protein [Adhaeribacter terrigena]
MAELHVQPKRSNPWWLWLILALVVIGLLYYFLRDRGTTDMNDRDEIERDTTGNTTALVTPLETQPFYSEFKRIA